MCLCVFVSVCECLCMFVSVCVCLCGVGVGFTVSVWWVQGLGLVMHPGPPFPGPPFPWTPFPWTPFPWTPFLDRPKFRSFFSPLPLQFFILFSLSCWSFSLNFGGVFEDQDPQMCTFGLSGCRVEPRRPQQTRPPGLHTTTRELQTFTFERTGASNIFFPRQASSSSESENLLQTTTVQKKSAHMASSQGQIRSPDALARTPPAQLRSMGSRHPCRNLRVVPTARGQRTGQRCKPTECSNGGTMRVSLTV